MSNSKDTAMELAQVLSEFKSINKRVQNLADNLSRLMKEEAEKHISCAKGFLNENRELKRKFPALAYLVDADSFAQQMLWERFHEKLSWEEGGEGFYLTAGFFGGQPVTILFRIVKLNKKFVAFYYPSGTYVDWNIVKEFLKKFAPGVPHTDASNFYDVFHALNVS